MPYMLKKECSEFTDMNVSKPKPYVHDKIYNFVPLNALDWFDLVGTNGEKITRLNINIPSFQPSSQIVTAKELIKEHETTIPEATEYSKSIQPETFTIPSFISSKKKKKGIKED